MEGIWQERKVTAVVALSPPKQKQKGGSGSDTRLGREAGVVALADCPSIKNKRQMSKGRYSNAIYINS